MTGLEKPSAELYREKEDYLSRVAVNESTQSGLQRQNLLATKRTGFSYFRVFVRVICVYFGKK
jgi:hypothetical protein